jgi:hypothetical protein
MKESLPENNHPLCQQAKRLLQQAKEQPDPTCLYPLQLVEWALEKGELQLIGPQAADLHAFLDRLAGADPERVLKVLTRNPVTGEELRDPDHQNDPVNLASSLIDQVHDFLIEKVQDYSVTNQLP